MFSTAFREHSLHAAENVDKSSGFAAYWSPERAVLSHLLDHHPRALTLEQLTTEIGTAVGELAVQRAVANLSAALLLQTEGGTLAPAPAVISFDQGATSTDF